MPSEMTETTATGDRPPPRLLTERMRSATKADHDKSDRLVNLKLALVLTSPPLYGEALSLFLPIYESIESILDRKRDHAQLGKVAPLLPQLRRAPGFREDVAFYVPSDRRKELEKSREQDEPRELADYLERLKILEKEDPVRILAYVYHMYMAIFAGGYIIKKTVVKAMGLPTDVTEGVHTFCFDDGVYAKGLSKDLKRILNEEISLTDEEAERVIEEGAEVFRRNNTLVSTVKGTGAWRNAADECARRVTRPLFAVAVAVAALVYWRWGHYSEFHIFEA